MKKKLFYIIPLLLLLAGLLGPGIFSDNNGAADAPQLSAAPQPEDKTGGTSEVTAPESQSGPDFAKEALSADSAAAGTAAASGKEAAAPAQKDDVISVEVAVVGKTGEAIWGPGTLKIKNKKEGINAFDALKATGLPLEVSPRWPDFIESVGGQRNKGQSGWMYKVNSEVPQVSAGKRKLAAGDRLIWWYSVCLENPPPEWEALKNMMLD